PPAAPPRSAQPFSFHARRVVAQAVEENVPAPRMAFGVLRLLRVGPVDRVESALHDAQARATGFRLEQELDEHRVVGARRRSFRLRAAEREAARRLQRLDLQLIRIAALEPKTPTATYPQLDLSLV